MEVEVTNNISKYDEYKRLILKRDNLNKEAFRYQEDYYRKFGDYIKSLFELKIECISLKKKISYCQMCVNKNEKIIKTNLDKHIEIIMKDYYVELDNLIKHVRISKSATSISLDDLNKVKKIYRYIAKKIHPDMHINNFDDNVKELWNRTMIAYKCNDLKELEKIEVLVNSLVTNDEIYIEDIDDRIKDIKEEIDLIVKNVPYQYKYLLEDIIEIENKIDDFNREIDEYKAYQKELKSILSNYNIEHYQS